MVACRPLAPEPGHTPDLVATWYAQANTSRKKLRHPTTKRSGWHSSRRYRPSPIADGLNPAPANVGSR